MAETCPVQWVTVHNILAFFFLFFFFREMWFIDCSCLLSKLAIAHLYMCALVNYTVEPHSFSKKYIYEVCAK